MQTVTLWLCAPRGTKMRRFHDQHRQARVNTPQPERMGRQCRREHGILYPGTALDEVPMTWSPTKMENGNCSSESEVSHHADGGRLLCAKFAVVFYSYYVNRFRWIFSA